VSTKVKTEDAQAESFCRSTVKRRAAHQNSEHEVEEQINEWANMTGFLCALGGVCLQRRSARPPELPPFPEPKKSSTKQQESGSVLTNPNQDAQCSVTQFVLNLLRLLICNNEKLGNQIQKHVKEMVGHEMSPALYPILFDQIKIFVEKFFDPRGQVMVSDLNTQFIEHTIFIMKNILDSKTDEPSEYLGMTSIEDMMLATVRYVRRLDMIVHSICIKTKLCQLVEAMMKRRDDLAFRQELKFRNKLVEYLTEWVMCAPPSSSTTASDITSYTK
jgi:neurofibromin 1